MMNLPAIGQGHARVTIMTETEEEASRRSYPNTRRRILVCDEEGRSALLDLDETERRALRDALDKIGYGY